jgi:hypothetical protein
MNQEREQSNWSHRLVKTAKITGVTVAGAVSGGIIYEGIQIGSRIVSEINSWQYAPCIVPGAIVVIGAIVIALGNQSSQSESPQKKYDMTPFSGGHVSEDIKVAPEIDEPPVH